MSRKSTYSFVLRPIQNCNRGAESFQASAREKEDFCAASPRSVGFHYWLRPTNLIPSSKVCTYLLSFRLESLLIAVAPLKSQDSRALNPIQRDRQGENSTHPAGPTGSTGPDVQQPEHNAEACQYFWTSPECGGIHGSLGSQLHWSSVFRSLAKKKANLWVKSKSTH